jgi:hypothetical protein
MIARQPVLNACGACVMPVLGGLAISDGRVIAGTLLCFDALGNVVLRSASVLTPVVTNNTSSVTSGKPACLFVGFIVLVVHSAVFFIPLSSDGACSLRAGGAQHCPDRRPLHPVRATAIGRASSALAPARSPA